MHVSFRLSEIKTLTRLTRRESLTPLSLQRPVTLSSSLLFPLTTTLSFIVTARERLSCCDKRVSSQQQSNYQSSCISWHNKSTEMWQLIVILVSSQSSKKREIFSPDWSCPKALLRRSAFAVSPSRNVPVRSRSERWCWTLLPTFWLCTKNNKNRITQTGRFTLKKGGNEPQHFSLSVLLSNMFSLSLTLSFFFLFSLTTFLPFLSQPVHGERKAFACCMHFLAQHIQGNVAAQGHPRKFPVLQEKRHLFAWPIEPDTMQSRAFHIVLAKIGRPRFAIAVHIRAFRATVSRHVSWIKRLTTTWSNLHLLLSKSATQSAHTSWAFPQRQRTFSPQVSQSNSSDTRNWTPQHFHADGSQKKNRDHSSVLHHVVHHVWVTLMCHLAKHVVSSCRCGCTFCRSSEKCDCWSRRNSGGREPCILWDIRVAQMSGRTLCACRMWWRFPPHAGYLQLLFFKSALYKLIKCMIISSTIITSGSSPPLSSSLPSQTNEL